MKPGLNYSEEDDKFKLLGNVFEFIENEKTKTIVSRAGFRQRGMAIDCIKIFFIAMFFNYKVSRVIDELNKKESLRNFAGIYKVPTETQVSEYFSRYNILQYFDLVNSILATFFKPHKSKIDEYIVDSTPVECDINVVKQFITEKRLERLKLKWGYSKTKKHFIGYKVTVVLEKNNLIPVSILIHPGAPHDSKIFEGILKEMKRRRLMRFGDILYFDRGYFSFKNYQIGVNEYRIVPVIFPRANYDINRIRDNMSLPLDIYKDMSKFDENKKELLTLTNRLMELLHKWEELKPKRGIIEDFFKAAKNAFNLDKFHSYTDKSMVKNILLTLLLTAIVVQCGFKTKTRLQRLSEGYVDFEEPKTNKKKKKNQQKKTNEKIKVKKTKEEQQTLDVEIKKKIINLDSYFKNSVTNFKMQICRFVFNFNAI